MTMNLAGAWLGHLLNLTDWQDSGPTPAERRRAFVEALDAVGEPPEWMKSFSSHPSNQPQHLLLNSAESACALRSIREALRCHAAQSLSTALKLLAGPKQPVVQPPALPGWLVVEIPVAKAISAEFLLRRVIRRLYFEGVLLGLNAHRPLRGFMRDLRIAHLQTFGSVKEGENAALKMSVKGDVSGALTASLSDLKAKLGGHLSAGGELDFASTLMAEYELLGEVAAEDILYFNLRRMQELDLQVNDLDKAGLSRRDQNDERDHAERLLEKVGAWVTILRERVLPDNPRRRVEPRVDLRVVVVLHAFDEMPVDQLVVLSEMLRNVLVSVPLQFIFAGGLIQELVWQCDQLSFRPRLTQLFKHHYVQGNATLMERMAGERARLMNCLESWQDAMCAEAGRRLGAPPDSSATETVTNEVKWFVSDLVALLEARISTWRALGMVSAATDLEKLLDFQMLEFSGTDELSRPLRRSSLESLFWKAARDHVVACYRNLWPEKSPATP